LTLDFHTNKRVVGDIAVLPSKRMRNKISGFITHLMKRIARGPVRGISLKLQEEERERRLDFVPEVCYILILLINDMIGCLWMLLFVICQLMVGLDSAHMILINLLFVFVFFLQKSAIEQDVIQIDSDTKDMLEAMDFKDMAGISVVATRS
jgi:small subunit ribosomal protein S17e